MDQQFTSRYDVLGPPNGCKGQCEGTGLIPIHGGRLTTPEQRNGIQPSQDPNDPPIYGILWMLQEAREPSGDAYHFIPCPDCQPTDRLVLLARRFLGGA